MPARLILLLAAAIAAAACTAPEPRAAGEPAAVDTLTIVERWSKRFDTADSPADFDDARLFRGQVVAAESSTHRVRAFDASTGDERWVQGKKGEGPGEYVGISQLLPFSTDLLAVVDRSVGRITLLRPDGSLDRVIAGERTAGDLTNVCSTQDGSLLAVKPPRFDVVRIDSAPQARTLYRLQWPNPTYNESMLLQQGLFANSHEGTCVIFQPRGDYFFAVDGDSLPPLDRMLRYVTPYPAQRIDRSKRFPTASPAGIAAAWAAVQGDSAFVMRWGDVEADRGLVDVYLLSTGRRVAVFRLPRDVYRFDVHGNTLLTLRLTEEGSVLTVYDR